MTECKQQCHLKSVEQPLEKWFEQNNDYLKISHGYDNLEGDGIAKDIDIFDAKISTKENSTKGGNNNWKNDWNSIQGYQQLLSPMIMIIKIQALTRTETKQYKLQMQGHSVFFSKLLFFLDTAAITTAAIAINLRYQQADRQAYFATDKQSHAEIITINLISSVTNTTNCSNNISIIQVFYTILSFFFHFSLSLFLFGKLIVAGS